MGISPQWTTAGNTTKCNGVPWVGSEQEKGPGENEENLNKGWTLVAHAGQYGLLDWRKCAALTSEADGGSWAYCP